MEQPPRQDDVAFVSFISLRQASPASLAAAYIDGAAVLGAALRKHAPNVHRQLLVEDSESFPAEHLRSQMLAAGWHCMIPVPLTRPANSIHYDGIHGKILALNPLILNLCGLKIRRVAFLDADTWVMSSRVMEPLLDPNLLSLEKPMAMVPDCCLEHEEFNTGVMYFEPKHADFIAVFRRMMGGHTHDQIHVNAVYRNRIVPLPLIFNAHGHNLGLSGVADRDVVVFHFTGAPKPAYANVEHLWRVRQGAGIDPYFGLYGAGSAYMAYFEAMLSEQDSGALSDELASALRLASTRPLCRLVVDQLPLGATPLHVFTYTDSAPFKQGLWPLAASVEALGGRLNVLGIVDPWSTHELPPPLASARTSVDAAVAAHVSPSPSSSPPPFGQKEVPRQRRYTGLSPAQAFSKLRKLFALHQQVDLLAPDEVVLFVDGFDVVVEAHSLPELRAAFDTAERKACLAAGDRALDGPVIFSGEMNCWPFPHGDAGWPLAAVSGDYRPDYIYDFGNNFRLRGDEVCDHWLHTAGIEPRSADASDMRLPFPNSGAFIGRARSVARFLRKAAEALKLYGDFDDQALAFVVALRAAAQGEQPPLIVDVRGELLASVHGLDLDVVAAARNVPAACNFTARARARPFALRPGGFMMEGRRLPPVLHFNGDMKGFFATRCVADVKRQAHFLGMEATSTRFTIYDHSYAVVANTPLSVDSMSLPSLWYMHMPGPHWTQSATQIVGAFREANSLDALQSIILTRGPPRQVVGELAPPSYALVRFPPAGGGRTSKGLGALFVKTSARCDRDAYCGLSDALRAAWRLLRPSGHAFAGLLWIQLPRACSHTPSRSARGDTSFRSKLAPGEVGRHGRVCGAGMHSTNVGASEALCEEHAVTDFLASLRAWEAPRYFAPCYQGLRRGGRVDRSALDVGAVFAYKDRAWRPLSECFNVSVLKR